MRALAAGRADEDAVSLVPGQDYLELLPVTWRAINDYGIRLDCRTYDSPELGRWRRQHSGEAHVSGPAPRSLRPDRTPATWELGVSMMDRLRRWLARRPTGARECATRRCYGAGPARW